MSLPYAPWFLTLFLLLTRSTSSPVIAKNYQSIHDSSYGQTPPTCDFKAPPTTVVSLSEFIENLNHEKALVIPCGHKVQVDPQFYGSFLRGVYVDGHLHFRDGGNVKFSTTFILVRGRLTIGSETHHHKGMLQIELLASHRPLRILNAAPFNGYDDRMLDFGRKAFVVYGGSVEIYGSTEGHQYAFLEYSAWQGDNRIRVDKPVTFHWKHGDEISIASSAAAPNGDAASFAAVDLAERHVNGSTTLWLMEGLPNDHEVRHVPLTDGSKRTVTLSPVVSRLTRNVIIRGISVLHEVDQWYGNATVDFIGGHFMVTHSTQRQVIYGVEFVAMGQPGILGRYPVHFHFNGPLPPGSMIRRSSVHHSKQRCIVIHATKNLVIDSNVAFRAAGHCYVTEDGLETGNRFSHNVGTSIRRAIVVPSNGNEQDTQSDDRPAVFWMASPGNHLIGNIAAGSQGSGFWYELRRHSRGASRDVQLTGWRDVDISEMPFGKFSGNTAHSVGVGLATYPTGSHPTKPAIFEEFLAWSVNVGWQTPVGSNQVMTRSVMVDVHHRGINAHNVEGYRVENVTIVGQLRNLMMRRFCGLGVVRAGVEGIHLEAGQKAFAWYSGMRGIVLKNVHFQGLDRVENCRPNAGIVLKVTKSDTWFPSASVLDHITFSRVDEHLKLEIDRRRYNQLALEYRNMSVQGLSGSGYLVSMPFEGQQPFRYRCRMFRPDFPTVMACPGQCWRHVSIGYNFVRRQRGIPHLKFIARTGLAFVLAPQSNSQLVDGRHVPWVVSRILPAGMYKMSMVSSTGDAFPMDSFDKWSFSFVRTDVRMGGDACGRDVELLVHGQYVPEAQ